MKINVLSLFSGCGGMDLGFEGGFKCLKRSVNTFMHRDWIEEDFGEWVQLKKTPFQTVFANDILPFAKTAWMTYFAKNFGTEQEVYRLESIVDLVKIAKTGEQVFPEDIDIVTGGFPCQDFSVAGKRKGFKSEKSHNGGKLQVGEPSVESRGQLYIWMREVISITKPKMFIAENVKGLTNLQDAKEIIEHDFADAGNGGYIVVPARVLQAADFGVPQSRERVLFFGIQKSALTERALMELKKTTIDEEFDPYPQPTHSYTNNYINLEPVVTCKEAFAGLQEPEQSSDLSQQKYSQAKFYGNHCQGSAEIKLNSVAPTIRSEHHGNIEYRRLSAEHGGQHNDELKKGQSERRLTVRECARIQTFPDDYEFVLPKRQASNGVSASEAYKIIGNAVPCVFAYNIAQRVSEVWQIYFKESASNDNLRKSYSNGRPIQTTHGEHRQIAKSRGTAETRIL